MLSPVLFNLVMDPLLKEMKSRKLGLSANGLYLGAFAHADDIRTASTNATDATDQVKTEDRFAEKNGLQLSLEKCGIVITGTRDYPSMSTLVGLPVENSVKCLGVWWSSSGSSHKSIEERISKARGAFFAHGQLGSFHGQLNPLSSRSLIESCVMPVLMYGSEFWHLNTTLLSRLESFQAELGKRILRLPRTTANSIPLITLDWPSMRCRCLCAKLCFLFRACSGDSNTDTLREEVFKSLSYSDVEALDLVKQCRLLELPYSTNFTSEVLSNSAGSLKGLKKRIIEVDRSYQLKQTLNHPSQKLVTRVAMAVGWLKVWDEALDRGPTGILASLSILKLLCKTVFADRKCPVELCSETIPSDHALNNHFLTQHTDLNVGIDSLFDTICSCSEELFTIGLKLSKFV